MSYDQSGGSWILHLMVYGSLPEMMILGILHLWYLVMHASALHVHGVLVLCLCWCMLYTVMAIAMHRCTQYVLHDLRDDVSRILHLVVCGS